MIKIYDRTNSVFVFAASKWILIISIIPIKKFARVLRKKQIHTAVIRGEATPPSLVNLKFSRSEAANGLNANKITIRYLDPLTTHLFWNKVFNTGLV